jgi:hypothetical protein
VPNNWSISRPIPIRGQWDRSTVERCAICAGSRAEIQVRQE